MRFIEAENVKRKSVSDPPWKRIDRVYTSTLFIPLLLLLWSSFSSHSIRPSVHHVLLLLTFPLPFIRSLLLPWSFLWFGVLDKRFGVLWEFSWWHFKDQLPWKWCFWCFVAFFHIVFHFCVCLCPYCGELGAEKRCSLKKMLFVM